MLARLWRVGRSSLKLFVRPILAALDRGILAFNPRLNNIIGTSHSGVDPDRTGRTILGTGTAFHAPITVANLGVFIFQDKDTVGTHNFAHAAAGAGLGIQLECGNSG